jgi:hypothetical protein
VQQACACRIAASMCMPHLVLSPAASSPLSCRARGSCAGVCVACRAQGKRDCVVRDAPTRPRPSYTDGARSCPIAKGAGWRWRLTPKSASPVGTRHPRLNATRTRTHTHTCMRTRTCIHAHTRALTGACVHACRWTARKCWQERWREAERQRSGF